VQTILSSRGISVDFASLRIEEIQSDSLEEIAHAKAKDAFSQVRRPVIVEDDGLFIESLKGFPGQYSSFVFKTIGNEGILRLLEGASRAASFMSLIAFHDGVGEVRIFKGSVQGRISDRLTEGGWGYDPIFIPASSDLTFAQLKERKNEYSHRRVALDNFVQWFIQSQK
jgi:XTP/dITP diphosphohydrolase